MHFSKKEIFLTALCFWLGGFGLWLEGIAGSNLTCGCGSLSLVIVVCRQVEVTASDLSFTPPNHASCHNYVTNLTSPPGLPRTMTGSRNAKYSRMESWIWQWDVGNVHSSAGKKIKWYWLLNGERGGAICWGKATYKSEGRGLGGMKTQA